MSMCMVAFSRTTSYSALEKVERLTDRPTWAYIVLTDACSHRCAWCYGGFNESLSHEMAADTFSLVLQRLEEIGVVQVTLAGGEPTEHPRFRDYLAETDERGFLIHIASHGEHIDADLAAFMAAHRVRQVQLNFQGRRFHDRIHGVAGSHARQIAAARHLLAHGIEVTTTTVVGKYNLAAVEAIFSEAAALGVDRLRVWESTGRGNPWRKDLEAREIFEHCQAVARRLGYTHTLSYDPEFRGDVTVACPQMAGMHMYITSQATLRFCGAVPGGPELESVDLTECSADELLAAYRNLNATVQGEREIWCPARLGLDGRGDDAAPVAATAPARAAPIELHA
jgi:MoaA/NifB/PqqE/SkfB family radical SAM enzyme